MLAVLLAACGALGALLGKAGATEGVATLDFAHFANGTGFASDLVLVNVSPHPVRPTIYFHDQNGDLIPRIMPSSLADVRSALAGSRGVDVTGGMLQKVDTMVALVCEFPSLTVIIADGRRENILIDLLVNRRQIGTRIAADA